MILLVSLYDNFLIDYPNIFFTLLVITLGSILFLVFKIIPASIEAFKASVRATKESIGQIGRIRGKKIDVPKFTINIVPVTKTVFRALMVGVSSVNDFFKFSEKKISKLIEKIAKEILID